jgi:hypothetical protein
MLPIVLVGLLATYRPARSPTLVSVAEACAIFDAGRYAGPVVL